MEGWTEMGERESGRERREGGRGGGGGGGGKGWKEGGRRSEGE